MPKTNELSLSINLVMFEIKDELSIAEEIIVEMKIKHYEEI